MPRLVFPLLQQFERYRRVARWFVPDAYFRFKRRSQSILLLNGVALGLQFVALGLLFVYLGAVEQGSTLELGGASLDPRNSTVLLLIFGISLLLLLLGSNIARYAYNVVSLGLGRAYEEYCAKRAIGLIRRYNHRPSLAAWEQFFSTLISSDSRYCGRIARLAIHAVVPAISFVFSLSVLAYLDLELTGILLVFVLIALPFLYFVNLRGARQSTAMERAAPESSRTRRSLTRSSTSHADEAEIAAAFREGPIPRHLDAYVGRLRATNEAALVSQILLAIAVAALLVWKGTDLFATGEGWSTLAIYILVLRLNLINLGQVVSSLTSVNRFYPQMQRYLNFLRAAEPESGVPDDPDAASSVDTALEMDWTAATPGPGARVVLALPPGAPHDYVEAVLAQILGPDAAEPYLVDAQPPVAQTVGAYLGVETGADEEARKAWKQELSANLADLDVPTELAGSLTLDTPLADCVDHVHWPLLWLALATLKAARSQARVIVYPSVLWSAADNGGSRRRVDRALRAGFADRIRVALTNEVPRRPASARNSYVAVATGSGLLALTDRTWPASVHRALQEQISGHSTETGVDPYDDPDGG